MKRTLPAVPPKRIYVAPEIIQQAPPVLRQAGFCDVLAKSVSDVDWRMESLLFNGNYCNLPAAIVAGSEKEYLESPERIRDGDVRAAAELLNGLFISGIAMSLAGSSAPASGGEHLISHVLDMREPMTGRKPSLHGLQVGMGIVFSASCYQRLASIDKKDLWPEAEARFQADLENIPGIWGNLAGEVQNQFIKKRDRLIRFNDLLPRRWDGLKPLCRSVRPPEFFLDMFRRAGFHMSLSALNCSPEEFQVAARTARTIRDRITVLDIAAHAGIIDDVTDDVLKML